MPRLNKIFHGIAFKDLKRGRCTFVKPIDELPFIKRCSNDAHEGLDVCLKHCFSVNYIMGAGAVTQERTKYFNTKAEAEYFRSHVVPNAWTDTNYRIDEKYRR
jgi:hypothetical protein